ncbi:MAG: 3-carboxy-cis,cis-muconate cycloisomerase [Pseudomonadota bacterium]
MTDWLDRLTGDGLVANRLSETAQIADMLRVEATYARACGHAGKVPLDMAEAAAAAIDAVSIDRAVLAEAALRDGMPVPGLVMQIKAQVAASLHSAVHQGLTSQDVMDTALILALREILEDLEDRIQRLLTVLDTLEARFGDRPLMGRTRMQAALPVTAGHRIAGWRAPWDDHLARLDGMRPRLLKLQLGGPVGTRDSFDGFGDAIAGHMGSALGLEVPGKAWHTERSNLFELACWLAGVAGSLGKIGTDLALMAQQGVDEVGFASGGASSAMAHKSNPVRAELLVALSRDMAGHLAAQHLTLNHEQERSGASWTLEWLVLPRMLTGCGAALTAALDVLADIDQIGGSAL